MHPVKTEAEAKTNLELLSCPTAQRERRAMQPAACFIRFDPVTVRAAARVLHLRRLERLSAAEARSYLWNLAAMDPHACADDVRSLYRVAARRAALGNTGIASAPAGRKRASRVRGSGFSGASGVRGSGFKRTKP